MADTKERKLPAPSVSAETQAYWDAAAKGKLLVRKCTSCGELHHYPRMICPFCFSDKTEWIEGSGKGKVYSHSTMASKTDGFTIAYVTLAEGPTMLTHIVDAAPGQVKIGLDVAIAFQLANNDVMIPMFAPVK